MFIRSISKIPKGGIRVTVDDGNIKNTFDLRNPPPDLTEFLLQMATWVRMMLFGIEDGKMKSFTIKEKEGCLPEVSFECEIANHLHLRHPATINAGPFKMQKNLFADLDLYGNYPLEGGWAHLVNRWAMIVEKLEAIDIFFQKNYLSLLEGNDVQLSLAF